MTVVLQVFLFVFGWLAVVWLSNDHVRIAREIGYGRAIHQMVMALDVVGHRYPVAMSPMKLDLLIQLDLIHAHSEWAHEPSGSLTQDERQARFSVPDGGLIGTALSRLQGIRNAQEPTSEDVCRPG